MNIYAPDYYSLFKCIAGACTHTCCAGWEIDIDDRTLEKYGRMPGELGDRLRAGIDMSGTPHFRLGEDGRCPMLKPDGLCLLIEKAGDGELCDICRDHPRFRNFWSCRTEVGLGMVCEEAARIILTRETPMKLVLIAGNGKEKPNRAEKYLLRERGLLLAGVTAQGPKARLIEYLIYRHIADALYDDALETRVAFVRYAYRLITADWEGMDISGMIESCRRFSDEIEYDSDNLGEMMKKAAFEERGKTGVGDLK